MTEPKLMTPRELADMQSAADRGWDRFKPEDVHALMAHIAAQQARIESIQRCVYEMLDAIENGAIDSAEIDLGDGAQPFKLHEEWAHHARRTISATPPPDHPVRTPFRYLDPCEVTPAQRDHARQSALYERGDMRLIWVNESDIVDAVPDPVREHAHDLLAALCGLANALELSAGPRGVLDLVPGALETARAAIAKAKGTEGA